MRKFLTSVADVYAYNDNDELVFTSKTLLDSSIETSLGSTPIRGGRGNQLQYTYYHTGEMNFTLTDTQWNLQMLGATVGSSLDSIDNTYIEDTITLSGGSGTVSKTPLSFAGSSSVYGWVTKPDDTVVRVLFTGSTFSVEGLTNQTVCIRYYALNDKATSIKISANMLPSTIRLVMEAQLNSSDGITNRIGSVQVIAPRVQLSGAFTISMTSDGVSNTPLKGMAIAYNDSSDSEGCSSEPYYAKVIEIIDSSNWYDNVVAISVEGGDFEMPNSSTEQLVVWAIPAEGKGSAFRIPTSSGDRLSFERVAGGDSTVTVGTNTGLVTSSTGDGSDYIRVYITDKDTVDTTILATVV